MDTTPKMNRSRGPEVLSHFAAAIADELKKGGLSEKRSSEIALAVLERMRFEFCGQLIYFPRNLAVKTDTRNDEIYRRFMANELTVSELSFEYQISAQMVYRIIATVRAKRREAHQTTNA